MNTGAESTLNDLANWALDATKEQIVHRGKQAAEALERAKAPAMVAFYTELVEIYRTAYKVRFNGSSAPVEPAPVQVISNPGAKRSCRKCGRELTGNELKGTICSGCRFPSGIAVQAPLAVGSYAPADAMQAPVVAQPEVADGTYTVVRNDGSHVTVKIETQPRDATFAPGERVASRLVGPDNSTDFVGFAFLSGFQVNVWKKKLGHPLFAEAADAVKVVLGHPARADEFREAYAMRSGRCSRCGRKLTVPASLYRGLGPVCAGIIEGKEG